MTTLAEVLAAHPLVECVQTSVTGQSIYRCGGEVLNSACRMPPTTNRADYIAHLVEAVAAAGLTVIPTPDVVKVAEALREAFLDCWEGDGLLGPSTSHYMAVAAVEAVIE